MKVEDRVILDLCAGTGAWSEPYLKAGYDVRRITLPEMDVREYPYPGPVHGILAAPPCTVFAASGARWPRTPESLREALAVVDACLRCVTMCQPTWWALENPIGTLRRWLGPPRLKFDPCDYGDPYTKRTLLWGHFRRPVPLALSLLPEARSRIHYMGESPMRATLRAVTPAGFAAAFFHANP